MKGTHHFVAIGVLVFLLMTAQAFADCVLNGKRLPEGTRIVVNSSKEKQFGFYRLGAGGSQAFNNLATTSAALFSLNAQSNPMQMPDRDLMQGIWLPSPS